MSTPIALDLYCCQGGASAGYARAGYRVCGIDINPQPRYPFPFLRMDALEALSRLLAGETLTFIGPGEYEWYDFSLSDLALAHASPPCQARTRAQKIRGNDHPLLIAPTRDRLAETGLPYVIENVVADGPDPDPLVDPVMLCGAMFRLETYRHRLFETNWDMQAPHHPDHTARTTKMGRPPVPGEYMHIVGNFAGVDHARQVMDMPWANRDGLREAIPPAYTEYVGRQLRSRLALQEAS